ncbi:MAG: gamma-glutamylcyclotransferase family protein [Polaromonas sp.]
MNPEAMPLPSVRHVFVYGTLRRGEQRDINRLRPAPRWVGWASVAGVMYHLGAYPGMVLGEEGDGKGRVRGEVYAISAELERLLDEIEDLWPQPSGEYVKREVAVQLDAPARQPGEAPEEVLCILYEIAPERTLGKPVIASGDWVQHRSGSAA